LQSQGAADPLFQPQMDIGSDSGAYRFAAYTRKRSPESSIAGAFEVRILGSPSTMKNLRRIRLLARRCADHPKVIAARQYCRADFSVTSGARRY